MPFAPTVLAVKLGVIYIEGRIAYMLVVASRQPR
jgi:hypothetical protein